MSDLAGRMRAHVEKRGGPKINGAWQMMLDAADEITRLTSERDALKAENEQMRDALVPFAKLAETAERAVRDDSALALELKNCASWFTRARAALMSTNHKETSDE